MTKTNETAAVATRRAKKVLGEADMLKPGQPTAAQLKRQMAKELAEESARTGAPRAAAALANGVTSRNAPQSAKAVSDAKGKAKASNKADAATQKPAAGKAKGAAKAKAEAKKAERAGKRDLAITLLVKPADAGVKGGRLAKLEAVAKRKPKTVADILGVEVIDASGKSHTIDMGAINGMLRREHIRLG